MSKEPAPFVSSFSCVLEGPLSAALPDDVSEDERFLAQAIDEAERALGRTWPNPPVGAVVVKKGRVLGVGHHVAAGEPHAEVVALERAGAAAKGATLYVSLEPCTHHGRTPPCADRVLSDGIQRVVVGVRDPNPKVSGRGLAKLRRHGLEVSLLSRGPVAARARALIAPFASAMQRDRPWVVAKVAASLDGRVATSSGHARWITGADARRLVHALRFRVDGVVVGSGTALADDPSLTVRDLPRGVGGATSSRTRARNPLRVLIDGKLRVDPSARLFRRHEGDPAGGLHAMVLHGGRATSARVRALGAAGVPTVGCGSGTRVDLDVALSVLRARGLTSVLVEAGPGLLGPLLERGIVDELWWFTAPVVVGADGRPSAPSFGVRRMDEALRLAPGARVAPIGSDVLFVGAPLGQRRVPLRKSQS